MMRTEHSDRSRLFASLQTIAEVRDAQREMLSQLPLRVVTFHQGADILVEGDEATDSCLVLSGLVCRYKLVADGKRQIVSLHLPGDLPDLQSLYLAYSDHGLAALSPSRVAFIPHEALRGMMDRDARMAALLLKTMLVDASIFREWIANIGRRDSVQRIAHLFCETFVRMRALGLVSDNVLSLPLTQAELADATGISAVHVNRVMQQLRRLGFITSRGNHHRINDWSGLKRAGDFSAAYLHLRQPLSAIGL